MSDRDQETENAVRARMGAVRKPWFLPIALLIVLATPLSSSILTTRIWHARTEVGPLTALVAGVLAAISVLGHSPAAYFSSATGQYSIYWAPRPRRARVVLGILACALTVAGIVADGLLQ